MSALDDFLTQGTLPFAGRGTELERLLEFWRATPYAQRLRASLVQAEAGIGKSRLLEELVRRVAAEEGVVVHVKLYPESSVSLAPLLAPALWHSSVGRELLRTEPEGTIPSVISALRRLCRLRPTLLVLEDTHLLSSESTPEFAALLNALADETISILSLCRPSEWRGRTLLESYLVERIEMEGLDEKAVAEIWESLFGRPAEPAIITMLHGATVGNALALRSVLRSAIDSRVILRSADGWGVSDPSGSFATLMKRNVELLSAGMVAHLDDRELHGASRLALLGEVFAREAADGMLEDAAEMIDLLMAKGVLATTPMLPSPLAGVPPRPGRASGPMFPSSAHPILVFTHTLLHKHLSERARVDPAALVSVIAGNRPLYSLHPLLLLDGHVDALDPAIEGLEEAVDRTLYIAWCLDQAFDQHSGLKAWDTSWRLFGVFSRELRQAQRDMWRLRYLQIRGSLLRFNTTGERERCSQEFYDAAFAVEPPVSIPFRMAAFSLYVGTHRFTVPDFYIRAWNELERMIGDYPELSSNRSYIRCVGSIAQVAAMHLDWPLLEQIRRRGDELFESGGEPVRQLVIWMIFPAFLINFSTEEEREDRKRLYALLRTCTIAESRVVFPYVVAFLAAIGEMDEAVRAVDETMQWYREAHVYDNAPGMTLDRAFATAMLGRPLDEIRGELLALADARMELTEFIPRSVRDYAASIALLRGDAEWGWNLHRELEKDATAVSSSISPAVALLFIARGDIDRAASAFAGEWPPQYIIDREGYETIRALLRFHTAGDGDAVQVIARAGELLRRPAVRIHDITTVGSAIRIMRAMRDGSHASVHDELRDAIGGAVGAMLEWLAGCELSHLMAPILEEMGEYLATARGKEWRSAIPKIATAREARRSSVERRERVRVSMLGTIQVGASGGDLAPLRGVRIRTLLGLMVADQMIGASLTPQEFVLLAGEDEDPELARKKRNMGVVRLREVMGADAILTDGRTPRLNFDLVEVDLLRADDLVKRSLAAAREGALVRAQPLLLEALEITKGEVPFPTLYESFFEAARDDFEFRLRSAVLDVARGLLREGDTGGAEEILRRAFNAMPDDEEIADLLREALVARGNRVEAERIRMRSREGIGVKEEIGKMK